MSKHTPGPWSWDYNAITAGWGDVGICILEPHPEGEEYDANARLIAAAPDLLDAVKQILAAWDANDSHGTREEIERSRKALAKAIGK